MEQKSTLKILAVEDDELNRALLSEIMAKNGYTLDIAKNGTEGLEKLKTTDYDAVLTDCKLPDIPGDRVAEAAKEEAPYVPVIMVTGSDISTTPHRAPPHVDRVVGKPYDINTLVEVIRATANKG